MAKPVTRTMTRCPVRSLPDGVTVTAGWVQENPGTGEREQACSLARAGAAVPVAVCAVARTTRTDAWLAHEVVSRHRMAATQAAMRQSI